MFLLFSGLTSIGRSDDTVGGRAEKASQNGERDLTTLTMLFHQIPPYLDNNDANSGGKEAAGTSGNFTFRFVLI